MITSPFELQLADPRFDIAREAVLGQLVNAVEKDDHSTTVVG